MPREKKGRSRNGRMWRQWKSERKWWIEWREDEKEGIKEEDVRTLIT